jgi:hypothetical protein
MFCVKEFADGMVVGRYFGSVVPVIGVIVIVVTNAATKQSGSSVELQTVVIEDLLKESSTRKTAQKPTAYDRLHFPLWIDKGSDNGVSAVSILSPAISQPVAACDGGKQTHKTRVIHDSGVPCCIICGRTGRFVDPFH